MKALMAIGGAVFVTCLVGHTAIAQTDVLTNASFESGLTGWTTGSHSDIGATGTCSFNGATAPGTETLTSLAGFPATDGTQIALGSVASTNGTSAITSCVLYQDVTIPVGATTAAFTFDIGVEGNINGLNNGYKVGIYSPSSVPGWSAPLFAGPMVIASVASANTTMQPRTSGSFDISALAGQAVRFAIINAVQANRGQVIGVDNVHLFVTVPPPPGCTNNANTCTGNSAGSGQYLNTADATCAGFAGYGICTNCTACTSGQYMTGKCAAGATSDTVVCHACSGACDDGQYQSAACSVTADRVCTACTTTACPPGSYQSAACSATADRVCSACTTTACPSGSYQRVACSATADRVCTMCSTACPSGTYLVAACSATSDLICVAYNPPPASGPDAGVAWDAPAIAADGPDSATDSSADLPDSRLLPDARSIPLTDTRNALPPADDARSEPDVAVVADLALVADLAIVADLATVADAGTNVREDGNAAEPDVPGAVDSPVRDGNLAGPDAPVADIAAPGARVDATVDALVRVDVQVAGSDAADAATTVADNKQSSGCTCHLSRRGARPNGEFALFMVGLVVAAYARQLSGRRSKSRTSK